VREKPSAHERQIEDAVADEIASQLDEAAQEDDKTGIKP
jgi:hypothetical protein